MANTFIPKPRVENTAAFLENELDSIDLPTYNFTLFMVPEANSASGAIFDKSKRIVIAESGVTADISIEDVSIISIEGFAPRSRTGTATQFTFTLREAYNARLMDQIYLASLELGISNYMKCPYYLELKILGRDKSSAPTSRSSASGRRWVYPMIITSFEASVSASGAVYSVRGAPYAQMAQMDQYGSFSESTTVNAGTVGAAINRVQDVLNERQRAASLSGQTKADKYEFVISDEMRNLKIVNVARTDEQSSDKRAQEVAPDGSVSVVSNETSIQINPGSSIVSILDTIMASSEEYQETAQKSISPDENINDGDRVNTMKRLHRVETETILGEYDVGRGDYSRTFRYVILPFDLGSKMVSPSETNADVSVAKHDEYTRRNLLQKRYAYLFTGENDQVIDFDLNFNFAWFVPMAKQAGLFTDHSQTNTGAKFRPALDDAKQMRINTSSFASKHASPSNPSESTWTDQDYFQKQVDTTATDSSEVNSLVLKRRTARVSEAQVVPQKPFSPASRYVSDVTVSSVNKQYADTKDRVLPVSFIESESSVDLGDTVEASNSSGRHVVNSLFTQAFSGVGGDLVNIELRIKGDPFWLARPIMTQTSVETLARLSVDPSEYVPTTNSFNPTMAENFILFVLRTPTEADDTTGVIKEQSTSNVYSGLYGVYKVEHEFSKGRFTQVLSCVRDPLVDISKIKGLI